MKTIIVMMICSILYLATMNLVNKKIESIDFTTSKIMDSVQNEDILEVSIKGGVRNPGTYKVNKGDTLGYLVTLAGGLLENADPATYNLNMSLKHNSSYYIGVIADAGDEKISINAANIALLDTLPGIGSVLAKRIVNYRSSQGNFGCLEDLKNVDGIGDALFEQIKDLICL